jgi:hypothetical protein
MTFATLPFVVEVRQNDFTADRRYRFPLRVKVLEV